VLRPVCDWPFVRVALHGCGGNSQDLGCAFDGQTAEETEFDNAALLRVDPGKFFERVFKCDQIRFAAPSHAERLVERQHRFPASSLGSIASPGVAYQNVTDHLSRNSEEMVPILPLNPLLINQLQISFVNEGGALQGMARAFSAKLARGQLAEFAVHQGRQLVERLPVPVSPFQQQARYVVRTRQSCAPLGTFKQKIFSSVGQLSPDGFVADRNWFTWSGSRRVELELSNLSRLATVAAYGRSGNALEAASAGAGTCPSPTTGCGNRSTSQLFHRAMAQLWER